MSETQVAKTKQLSAGGGISRISLYVKYCVCPMKILRTQMTETNSLE